MLLQWWHERTSHFVLSLFSCFDASVRDYMRDRIIICAVCSWRLFCWRLRFCTNNSCRWTYDLQWPQHMSEPAWVYQILRHVRTCVTWSCSFYFVFATYIITLSPDGSDVVMFSMNNFIFQKLELTETSQFKQWPALITYVPVRWMLASWHVFINRILDSTNCFFSSDCRFFCLNLCLCNVFVDKNHACQCQSAYI